MSIYHCSIKIGSRGKGQSAVAAAAYRSGQKLTDEELGAVSDYTRKSGVVYSEVSLCDNAPAEYINREILWNSVQTIEKASNSRLWREFEVALPQELSREEQIDTVRDYVKTLTEQGMCCDWSIHDKHDGNPHAHIMATVRSIKENGEWAAKCRKVYDLDENGQKIVQKYDKLGHKQYKSHKEDYNDWNNKERVEEWREKWAECCNKRLSEDKRIDHRSYKRQGIDKEPTIHEGYKVRMIAKKSGIALDRMAENWKIKQRNEYMQRIKQELEKVQQELEKIIKEKERAINAGKQRIAELLARRSRTVNSDNREPDERERETEGRERTAETSYNQSEEIDTETLIRRAKAVIDSSRASEESGATARKNRELAEQRRAAEESRRAEMERRAADQASRASRSSGQGFGRGM
ncbi:mobilization protein MobA [Ruminococcus sp. AF21-11]|jgi:hypothetical protein|nr:mobilization protein MobA [Ruminococcus sp. AF21-11]